MNTEQTSSPKQLNETRGISNKPAFLAAYVRTASITKAARAAKIDRSLHYKWLLDDPEYARAFHAARLEAGDLLEDEAVRRAYQGINEAVVYQGGLCYTPDQYDETTGKLKPRAKPLTVKKYDSALLMKLLDGFLPERYKRRGAMEVSGPAGGPIQVETPDALKKLTDEELQNAIAIARKLTDSEEK